MKKLIILTVYISFLFLSCNKSEPESDTEFIIKNLSSHKVELTVFDAYLPDKFNTEDITVLLNINSEKSYIYSLDGEHMFIDFTFGRTADSAYIIFNNSRKIKYKRNDLNPRNIIDINSWKGLIVSDTYFIYTYSITDEDYENAIEIK